MNELDDILYSPGYSGAAGTTGDQPGDYDIPKTGQTPGWASTPTWTGGLAGTQGDQEGDYDMPKTGQTPGAFGSFDINKILSDLLSGAGSKIGSYAQNNPLQSLLMMGMLASALSGGNKQSVGGYKGPGINMGLKANRGVAALPAARAYGAPVSGQKMLEDVTYAAEGKYLRGNTDGMADEIPSSIDGKQPAALSHGEFVVPADVVSHLGNGNSDAGAKVLYGMMDKVRKARTGTTKQGKRINPEKFTPGGQAYAGGGAVAFAEGGQPANTTTEQNIASWAGPYVMDYLSRAQALSNMQYQPYQGQLTAGTSPLQQQAFEGLSGLAGGYPGQFDIASRFATQAGQRAGQAQYTPGQFTMGQVNAPTLQDLQMQAPEAVSGAQAQASQLAGAPQVQAAQMQGPGAISPERVGAERVAAPSLQNLQMQAAAPVSAQQVGTPQMQAAQTGYQPNLQTFQMGPAQQVGTQGFTSQAAQDLMSPYMQNVVSRQQQAAQREADIASQAQKAQFAQSGAFGGSRQGVQAARAAEALARQKGDIQAQGLQSAYQQAQQQFNTQQQAAMQAALANQAAGLTTGQQNLAAQLGVQQLGTQTGTQLALANLSNQQQAAVQNQAAQLQAQGLNAQQAMQAALANQQAQQQANLQNLSAGLQTQGLQAQTGMQAQQLNQATGLQAALANQQAGMQAGQFNAQQAYNTALQNAQMQQQANLANQGLLGQYGLQQGQFGQQAALQNAQLAQQAALANQQMGYNTGLQNLQARLGIQQLGAGQNLQAQLANQQNLMQAQQAQEQSRQFGAGYGMQGIGQQLSAAGQLGQLGQGQFGTQLSGINALLGAGATQYGQEQAGLTALQNEYNKQMMWPYQQLQFQQSMLQGLPIATASNMQNLSPMQSFGQFLGQIGGINQVFNPTTPATGGTKP